MQGRDIIRISKWKITTDTFLFCNFRACNKHVQSFDQLLSTHVPTVWAIDQYRIYKDVRNFHSMRWTFVQWFFFFFFRYSKDHGKSLTMWMFHYDCGTLSVIMKRIDVSPTDVRTWCYYVFQSLARCRYEIVVRCGIRKFESFVPMFR